VLIVGDFDVYKCSTEVLPSVPKCKKVAKMPLGENVDNLPLSMAVCSMLLSQHYILNKMSLNRNKVKY
jgi:hypothetical protein